jgi:hypothetical protein
MRQSHPPWQRRGSRFCDLGLHARENEKTAQHDKKAAYPQADGAQTNLLIGSSPRICPTKRVREGDQPSARFIPGNCVEIAFGAITRE